jgi:hypothetical protein
MLVNTLYFSLPPEIYQHLMNLAFSSMMDERIKKREPQHSNAEAPYKYLGAAQVNMFC